MDIHTLIAASPRILLLLWGLALPFCAFAGWLFLYLLANQSAPVAADVLAGCFLLIAVTLLVGTVELTLHYVRYDALRLTLTGEPPTVGKCLDAIIALPASVATAWVGVELACVYVSHQSIGANRTASFEKDCWSHRRQFRVRHDKRRGRAVVRFDIPESLPPSAGTPAADARAAARSGRGRYLWELRIEASGADPEFRRALGVHVRPPASSAGEGGLQARTS